MTRVRVVLADDEHLVRGALRAILACEEDLEVVGEAATGAEAISVVRELPPNNSSARSIRRHASSS